MDKLDGVKFVVTDRLKSISRNTWVISILSLLLCTCIVTIIALSVNRINSFSDETPTDCPAPFTLDSGTGTCFYLHAAHGEDQTEAAARCAQINAHLMVVDKTDGLAPVTDDGYVMPTNIALNKPAVRSTVWPDNTFGAPENANDGNRDSNFFEKSCTETNDQLNPYWYVDLGATHMVTGGLIVNRMDCCSDDMRNFTVDGALEMADPFDMAAFTSRCFYFPGIASAGQLIFFNCTQPIAVRYMRMRIWASDLRLMMCEMEIYELN